MNSKVEQLTSWFEKLSVQDKRTVHEYLYGKGNYTQGIHLGLPPIFKEIMEGVSSGPAPDIKKGERCPTCHRPY